MKKVRYKLLPWAILGLMVIFTSCGKKPEEKSDGKSQVSIFQKGIEDGEDEEEQKNFLLRLEGNTLTLFEISDFEEKVLRSVNIDRSYYPSDDIKKLESGIALKDLINGYEILENFTN